MTVGSTSTDKCTKLPFATKVKSVNVDITIPSTGKYHIQILGVTNPGSFKLVVRDACHGEKSIVLLGGGFPTKGVQELLAGDTQWRSLNNLDHRREDPVSISVIKSG